MAGRGLCKTGKKRIESVERQKRAMELRLLGKTYEAIAQELGCTPAGAWKMIVTAMDATIRDPADKLRQIELDKLDRQEEVWAPLARLGDKDALDAWIKIQASRRKLLGLDAPDSSVVTNVIVPAASEEVQKILASPAARLKACELDEALGQTTGSQQQETK
jgi:hypothetical protein